MATTKEQLTELARQLREAGQQQDPIAQAAIRLIALVVTEQKDSLVSAEGDDMLRMQGAARRFTKLHTELTTTPPNIAQELRK